VGRGYLAVGTNGVILKSQDGETWLQVANPTDTALTAVSFANANTGWAVGHDAVILGTHDGGASWKLQNWQPELYMPLFAIQPADAANAIAVGAFGTIKATHDGGRTWSDIDAPELTSQKLHLNAITRVRDGRWLVAGERGLVGISDDGINWKPVPMPYEGSFFGALPIGEHGAVVFGMRGNVFVSENGEEGSWQKIETATTSSFFGGQPIASDKVLLAGSDGAVITVSMSNPVASTVRLQAVESDKTLAGIQTAGRDYIVVGEAGVRRVRR